MNVLSTIHDRILHSLKVAVALKHQRKQLVLQILFRREKELQEKSKHVDWRNNCKKEETNLSAVISENFVGFQDMIKFPTQSKLPSYSTPFTVNPVSLNLQYH